MDGIWIRSQGKRLLLLCTNIQYMKQPENRYNEKSNYGRTKEHLIIEFSKKETGYLLLGQFSNEKDAMNALNNIQEAIVNDWKLFEIPVDDSF